MPTLFLAQSPAIANLVLDRGLALVLGRIAGIDYRTHVSTLGEVQRLGRHAGDEVVIAP
jgi:hypothetical protein